MKFYSILMINIFGWSTSFYPQVNFISHTITTFDDRARLVYVIDVDQVGDNDVLPASTNDNKISWYRNNSVVGVESISNVITNKFSLNHNYPNPFNTSIQFSLPQTSYVALEVFILLVKQQEY